MTDTTPDTRMRVKPLEWTPAANDAGKDGLWFVAIDVFGKKHEIIRSYHGQNGAGWTYGDTWYGNIDEAKAAAQADYERRILSALEPAAPESEPRPMTGFFSNLSPEGQAAALAYDGPEPNIGDTAPEDQQEPVAWGKFCERKIIAVSLHKRHHYTVPLYTLPSEQAVTEAMVEAAAKAVVAEWKKMIAETSPYMSPGDHARAFVSPGNYRLIRAALSAAASRCGVASCVS